MLLNISECSNDSCEKNCTKKLMTAKEKIVKMALFDVLMLFVFGTMLFALTYWVVNEVVISGLFFFMSFLGISVLFFLVICSVSSLSKNFLKLMRLM